MIAQASSSGVPYEILLIIYFFAVSLVGAVAFRASCWLHNAVVGRSTPEKRVPEPDFRKSMFIMFVAALVGSGTGLGLRLYIVAGSLRPIFLAAVVPVTLVTIMIAAALKLPTTFARALSVAVLSGVVAIAMAAIVAGIVWVVVKMMLG
jgi:hypothetical protein